MKISVSRRVFVASLLIVAMSAPAFARGKKKASGSTAPGKYQEWGPDIDEIEILKTFHLSDYKTIVVQEFDTDSVKLPDKDDNTYQPVKKVLASATEGLVQGMRGNVDQKVVMSDSGSKNADTLIIRGKVLQMNPGSKAARVWAGFGAGAAGAQIEGEIVDAKTKTVLAKFTQERRSGVGIMGGDYQELMQKNLNAIGEDVANLLKAF